MPRLPPVREKIAVLMPSRLPATSTSAPPELPGLIAASVWMKFSKVLMPRRVAAERADDARGHGLADVERVADRQHDVADLQVVDVAEVDHRQLVEVDLEHRDVRFRIGADRLGARRAAVAERHLDVVGAFDDVVVGEQVAGRRDDHARAEADLALLGRLARAVAEEEAEHRVVAARPLRDAAGGDADDRRRGPLGGAGVARRRRAGADQRDAAHRRGQRHDRRGAAATTGSGPRLIQAGLSVATTNSSATAIVTVCENRSQALRIVVAAAAPQKGAAIIVARRADNGAWLHPRTGRSP